MKTRMMRTLVLIGVAVFASGLATAVEPQSPLSKKEVKDLIRTARTPDDHLKLARYYRFEQKRLEAEVAEHREMGAAYAKDTQRQPVPKYPSMGQHCQDLVANYTAAAKAAGNLAAMHEEMAKAKPAK